MASYPARYCTDDGVVFFDPRFNGLVHLLESVEQIDVQDVFAQRFALLGWAVDSVWEQEKLEARKMLGNGDESHLSSSRSQNDTFLEWVAAWVNLCPASIR
jgi:hypothetical protein